MQFDPPTIQAALVALLQEASDLITAPVEVQKPWNPVTDVDLTVDAFLTSRLPFLVNAPILSEESSPNMSIDSTDAVFTWVVDPIDGTRNLVAGRDEYAVSVALLRHVDVVPVLAAVHLPKINVTFAAHLGGGAERNGEPFMIVPDAETGLVGFGTPDTLSQEDDWPCPLLHSLRNRGLATRQSGSAVWDACQVIEGRLEAYVEHGLKLWDALAVHLIAQEAGAFSTLRPHVEERSRFDYCVATSQRLRSLLMEI